METRSKVTGIVFVGGLISGLTALFTNHILDNRAVEQAKMEFSEQINREGRPRLGVATYTAKSVEDFSSNPTYNVTPVDTNNDGNPDVIFFNTYKIAEDRSGLVPDKQLSYILLKE